MKIILKEKSQIKYTDIFRSFQLTCYYTVYYISARSFSIKFSFICTHGLIFLNYLSVMIQWISRRVYRKIYVDEILRDNDKSHCGQWSDLYRGV